MSTKSHLTIYKVGVGSNQRDAILRDLRRYGSGFIIAKYHMFGAKMEHVFLVSFEL